MALLAQMFLLMFSLVDGAAFPEPTAAPALALDKRQNTYYTVYSPSIYGQTTSFVSVGVTISGTRYTVSDTTSGAYPIWNFCPVGGKCYFATSCRSGTLYYDSSMSDTCTGTTTLCGADLLYQDVFATKSWIRLGCADPTSRLTDVWLLTTPASGIITTSIIRTSIMSPTTTTTTGPQTTTPAPATPVGAIVGGLIGGLAVIGLVAIGILLVLRRRRSHQAPQLYSTTGFMRQGEKGPGQGTAQHYDPKHRASEITTTASQASPPPLYQSNMDPTSPARPAGASEVGRDYAELDSSPGATQYPHTHGHAPLGEFVPRR